MQKRPLQPHIQERRCGILLHITSLPGPYGIGDIGPRAREFLKFLKGAGQGYWQFLPLSPTSPAYGHSPYMSPSAFAGNPLLISIEDLLAEGLLEEEDVGTPPEFSKYLVDFETVEPFKMDLLKKAFLRAKAARTPIKEAEEFLQKEKWVMDHALFMAIKKRYQEAPWYEWPKELAKRDGDALRAMAEEMRDEVLFHAFCQYLFETQWQRLKKEAEALGIRLFGDMPIYVSPDSVDVWANQEAFDLDPETLRPSFVAGVPPDYFSKTGQRWGNPLYRWNIGRSSNPTVYQWWRARFLRLRRLVHVIRIDHFRGFEAYWKVPSREKTAINGKWVKGPGISFFRRMGEALLGLEIIAEDLGTITPEVERLRKSLGFPGMKVLQFAFDSDEKNPYLPHNFKDPNCVVYTGTHDNSTTVGWYLDPKVSERSKARARRYANSDGSRIHWDFIRMAYSSVARLAIIPMQDCLGFGDDCRMNKPSTSKGNWRWRLAPEFITNTLKEALLDEARFYNRVPS